MTDNAVKVLLQTLEQNLKDTGTVLNQYEATHDDFECCMLSYGLLGLVI